jgi:hypothetical protein
MTPSEEVPCASSPVMKFDDTLPEVTAPTEPTINDHARVFPPPEPPPTDIFPPCSIIDDLMQPPSTPTICVTQLDLRADQEVDSTLALLPYQIPSILDSVTRVVCSSLVCGVRSDDMTSVKILRVAETNGKLIDGGSNVCVTGDLTILLDVSDITPIDISVALDRRSTSLDDRITKRGLLPLTLSDGSVYYQTCFYCANIMVETIYHLLPSLHRARYSTIGTKKAARILPLLDASGSQAKTASCLCFSIWNTTMDSTIVHRHLHCRSGHSG